MTESLQNEESPSKMNNTVDILLTCQMKRHIMGNKLNPRIFTEDNIISQKFHQVQNALNLAILQQKTITMPKRI